MKTANSLSNRHEVNSKAMTSKRSTIRAHNLKRMEDLFSGGVTEEVTLMRELTNQVSCSGEKS